MRTVIVILFLALVAGVATSPAQMIVSNKPVADTFVNINNPTNNYGGAGALEVAGPAATNATGAFPGVTDTFMRFSLANQVAAFDTAFGVGDWAITNVTLQVTETVNPNNAIFGRGPAGQFQIFWIADDTWVEGVGMPSSVNTNGTTSNDEATILSAGQVSLGTFSNANAAGLRSFSLSLPASFLNDISSLDSTVSLYFTAISANLGFNFNSVNFGTGSAQPSLELTAIAVPEPSTLCLLTLSAVALAALRRRSR